MNDHKRDNSAVTKVDGFIKSSNCNLHQKRTTLIWKFLVEHNYGSVDWVLLKNFKQNNLVELDEYAMSNEISD